MPMMRAAHMVMPGTENTAQVFPGTAPVLMQRSPYATLAYEVTPYGASALTGYPSTYPHVIRRGPTDFIAMFAPRGAAMGYAAAPARDPQWARELLNAAVGRRGAAPQRTAPVARGASTTPPATTKPAATQQANNATASARKQPQVQEPPKVGPTPPNPPATGSGAAPAVAPAAQPAAIMLPRLAGDMTPLPGAVPVPDLANPGMGAAPTGAAQPVIAPVGEGGMVPTAPTEEPGFWSSFVNGMKDFASDMTPPPAELAELSQQAAESMAAQDNAVDQSGLSLADVTNAAFLSALNPELLNLFYNFGRDFTTAFPRAVQATMGGNPLQVPPVLPGPGGIPVLVP